MDKKRAREFTIEVIDFLLSIPEAMVRSFDRKEFYYYMHGMTSERILTVSEICKLFDRFKRRGYIEVSKDEYNNESVIFTNKAKLLVVDKIAQKYESNDRYCLVSFDIPESLRSNRDMFRRAIKRMGFKQIQKSLWVSNRRIGHLVEMAAEEYKVSEYVVYLIAEVTNIDKIIKQELGLALKTKKV